jgi:hypothetical protein
VSEFVIKGKHSGLSVEQAVEFSRRFEMPVEGAARLAKDLADAVKLPPIARVARIARLEFLRDSSAADTAWALSLGGQSGSQIDGELASLRRVTETQDYYTVTPDPLVKAEASRRRYALQEFLKGLIAQAESVDASPEA